MVSEISVKKYKIFNLKHEYIKLSTLHHRIQLHINTLYKYNILNTHDYTRIITDTNDFIKQTNAEYNKYIINIDEGNSDDSDHSKSFFSDDEPSQNQDEVDPDIVKFEKSSLLHFIRDLQTHSEQELFQNIHSFIKAAVFIGIVPTCDIDKELFEIHKHNPMMDKHSELKALLKHVGYPTIHDLLSHVIDDNYKKSLSHNIIKQLDTLNNIIVPIKYTTVVDNSDLVEQYSINDNEVLDVSTHNSESSDIPEADTQNECNETNTMNKNSAINTILESNVTVLKSVSTQSLDQLVMKTNNQNSSCVNRLISKSNSTRDELLRNIVVLNVLFVSSINIRVIITGYIPPDPINGIVKTCQIANPVIYAKKKKIETLMYSKDFELVSTEFKKKYIKYVILSDLVGLSVVEFITKFKEDHDLFIDVSNKSFMSLMKDFVKKDNTIYNMFITIRMLLFGNTDLVNIAGLLFSLVKDNSLGSTTVADTIYEALHIELRIKLKMVKTRLKEELTKIKTLTIDDIDYKKQVLSLPNIPLKVKSLANEKIEEMSLNNNEYFKQLQYVKTIIQYPWSSEQDDVQYQELRKNKQDRIAFLDNVHRKLTSMSYGHKEAKTSLMEIIGKWIANPSSSGNVLALQGPPGVGKTMLAKNVSTALDIPFVQITLGGQNDGELLHGHGYTYSGSQPGMIVRKMIEAGQSRCIMYFDELDKTSAKNGSVNEIMSILIHLTDPCMNESFQDRFFQGVDFPLDKVIMIFSYNDSSLVDPILLDRFKEIKVKPYTMVDKVKIIQNFILPETLTSIGFPRNAIIITESDIEYIIEHYTNEAGVRGIKRMIEQLVMKLNIDRLYGKNLFHKNDFLSNQSDGKNITLTRNTIVDILDKPLDPPQLCPTTNQVGIINGLYATSIGTGGLVPIQIHKTYSSSDAQLNITLTGSQGDVMKESVYCAYTAAVNCIAANKEKFNITDIGSHMKKHFPHGFHVHAPSSAVPKDGPSAGTAFMMAFISRITNIPIHHNIAITGEIDLNGNITKIGGLQYKLIGAKKGNVKTVIAPCENTDDYEEIVKKNKKLLDKEFKVMLCSDAFDILDIVLDL